MESAFQFSNPSLTKMEFCINEEFESSQDKEVKIAMNMGVQIDRSATDNNARVSLTLEIGKRIQKIRSMCVQQKWQNSDGQEL